jgi:hypothetical protein
MEYTLAACARAAAHSTTARQAQTVTARALRGEFMPEESAVA